MLLKSSLLQRCLKILQLSYLLLISPKQMAQIWLFERITTIYSTFSNIMQQLLQHWSVFYASNFFFCILKLTNLNLESSATDVFGLWEEDRLLGMQTPHRKAHWPVSNPESSCKAMVQTPTSPCCQFTQTKYCSWNQLQTLYLLNSWRSNEGRAHACPWATWNQLSN